MPCITLHKTKLVLVTNLFSFCKVLVPNYPPTCIKWTRLHWHTAISLMFYRHFPGQILYSKNIAFTCFQFIIFHFSPSRNPSCMISMSFMPIQFYIVILCLPLLTFAVSYVSRCNGVLLVRHNDGQIKYYY